VAAVGAPRAMRVTTRGWRRKGREHWSKAPTRDGASVPAPPGRRATEHRRGGEVRDCWLKEGELGEAELRATEGGV
jgi:hypothetical protein